MPRAHPAQLDLFSDPAGGAIRVVADPDPWVLERELIGRIEQVRGEASPLAPVLVLVPTRVLARHLRHRLTARRAAWLAVEVQTFRGMVHRILEGGADAPPRAVSKRLLEAVLERVLRELPDNRLTRFVDRRPSALRSLLGTLNDLREAGIPAAAVRECAAAGSERDLAAVFERYGRALEKLAPCGLTDEAGLVTAAARRAAEQARHYRGVFVHGAYELVGMHLDLVRAISAASPVTVLVPVRPGAPGTAYGEEFARRHLLPDDAAPEAAGARRGGLLGPRLAALYDERASPGPLPEGSVGFRHTQGPDAEVTAALRHALRAVEQGLAPSEIALVARTLDPYAASIERSLSPGAETVDEPGGSDEGRLPCSTTLAYPVRREPRIHDLLVLLRVLAEDFPRALTVELLRSPRVRWSELLRGEAPPPGDLADRWSREGGILGGIGEWTGDLATWIASEVPREELTDPERAEWERRRQRRVDQASRIARALGALHERFGDTSDAGWREHAARIETLAERLLPEGRTDRAGQATESLRGLLREMRDLAVITDDARVPFERALGWLGRAVDETELPHDASGRGAGVRVLDAMQARGLTFRRVFLLGMHAAVFPRKARQDAFLGDGLRQRLRERTGCPLGLKRDGDREERQLLGLMLGAAGERLDVSWQRADDSGRAAVPSLALREVFRVTRGSPEMEHVASAERISSHPARRMDDLIRSSGLAAPAEELLLLSLRSPNPESARQALVARDADLAAGLDLIRGTESFAPGDLRYDGRIGASAEARAHLGVTALEQLGRCPLQFFFARVLRIRELEREASPFEMPYDEMGRRVHQLMERLYRELADAGLLESGDPERAVEHASARLDDAWDEAMGDLGKRRADRLGLLWRLTGTIWKDAIRLFLAKDLARIVDRGWRVAALEEPAVLELDTADGGRVAVRGRFDRRLVLDGRSWVGDYKTYGRLEKHGRVADMLRGERLQVPLYRLMAGDEARVSLLGVGPYYDLESDNPDYATELDWTGFDDRKRARTDGFLETVQVLLALDRGGAYPLRPAEHCSYCAYLAACRQNHPPTLERDANAPDTADYRDVLNKKDWVPTLRDVRRSER